MDGGTVHDLVAGRTCLPCEGRWGDHAEMAKRLPKLIAYRHGKVVHDYDHPDAPAWDGHAVLTFPTREDLDAALASPQWAEAIRHVGAMKGKRICLFTEEADLLAGEAG